ncbi:MAG: UDP-N-acetylmuramate--L-alanine ligase [Bdellovibrionaceae bacterium]|jgi:UDP-N-acetylmuramate--alanine ligase|nr:UDP-N-acetylmuramate--L-alanine ligase [Pseudobdellovibrionaceae bacterium]
MKFNSFAMHFVGIGGSGMSGLAELFFQLGARVSGSDVQSSSVTEGLKQMGITIYQGHQASNLGACDVVVYSSAIQPDNPEILEAKRRRIPLIRRAEALAELMRMRRGIAIAGSHGKTTTTSYLAHIFLQAHWHPMVVVGGKLHSLGSGAFCGHGDWLIAEADESDGSFLHLSPEVVVVTNVDNDHLDHYGSMASLEKAFFEFASRVPFYGYVLYWGDDPRMRQIFQSLNKPAFSYGFSADNDYRIISLSSAGRVELWMGSQHLVDYTPPLAGRHNMLNAAAALIVAERSGMDVASAAEHLKSFAGVERRLQHLARVREIDFYTDYAHHPTEIRATLQAFRERFPSRRLVVVFQPHRYSRTQVCWNEFLSCFDEAQEVALLDIYPAGEKPIEGITAQTLAAQLKHPQVKYWSCDFFSSLELPPTWQAEDVVIFMGAGDIYKKSKQWLAHL